MKKKLIVIFLSILIMGLGFAGTFFMTKIIDEMDVTKNYSDADFLVSTKQWQKQNEPTVIWSFSDDGKCKVTTNETEFFDCTWYLEKDILGIKTSWLYDLEDEFEFRFNKNDKTFQITSKSDGKISVFESKPTIENDKSEETPQNSEEIVPEDTELEKTEE